MRCDRSDRWQDTLSQIVDEQGVSHRILVYTEGGGRGDCNDIDLSSLASSFKVKVLSLRVMVQTLLPQRATIHSPCRMVISRSPAAYECNPRYLGPAPSRAAQRVLAETLHAMRSDHGIEFGILSIAGTIDEPKLRRAFPTAPDALFIRLAAIADRVVQMFADGFAGAVTIATHG